MYESGRPVLSVQTLIFLKYARLGGDVLVMRTELRKRTKTSTIFGLVYIWFTFGSRSSEEKDEKLVQEKVGKLSSLASPQIAGALIKMNANLKPKLKAFCHSVGEVLTVMTSSWKFRGGGGFGLMTNDFERGDM